MRTAIVFDREFLVTEGAQQRFWCGSYDPDPVIAQIGAVRLGLGDDFPLLETKSLLASHVTAMGRSTRSIRSSRR